MSFDVTKACPRVTDYDDSIGGEGEIVCGAPLSIEGHRATCSQGHKWDRCECGHRSCRGWKVPGR